MRRSESIYTARLILRAFKRADAADVYEYAKDARVGPCAGWAAHNSLKETKDMLLHFLMRKGTWAVTLPDTGKAIGSVGLNDTEVSRADTKYKALEIGYVLSPAYWGNGYAREAVASVVDYAFCHFGVEAVWCGYFDFNERSKKLCQALGFSYVRTLQSTVEVLGNRKIPEELCILTQKAFYSSWALKVTPAGK